MRSLKKQVNQNYLAFVVILLSILIADWRILFFNFQLQWDDQWVAINAYTDQGLTIDNIIAIFSEFYHGQYAPINQLYYTILKYLFGYDPFYFHLAGVLVHYLSTCLVFLFVKRISFHAFKQTQIVCFQTALLSSILFAVHPFNLEAASWISASKILLYAFFYLLAIHLYIEFLLKKNNYYLILTIILFLFSFGAKEQAVTFPLCLLLLDYIFDRPIISRQVWIEKVPVFIASIYLGLVTIDSQQVYTQEVYHYTFSYFERAILACYTLSEYLTKCILPIRISYLYPFPFEPNSAIPLWLFIYPIALPLIFICLKDFLLKKWVLFGLMFFLIHILLALNILSLARYAVVADRYAYISSIGICFIIASGTIKLLQTNFKFKLAFKIITLVYVTGFVTYTNIHSQVWTNSYLLKKDFNDTIESRPDYPQIRKKHEAEAKAKEE